MNRYIRPLITLGVVFLVLWLIRSTFGNQLNLGNGPKEIPYSTLVEHIKAKEVESATFHKDTLDGKLDLPMVSRGSGSSLTSWTRSRRVMT